MSNSPNRFRSASRGRESKGLKAGALRLVSSVAWSGWPPPHRHSLAASHRRGHPPRRRHRRRQGLSDHAVGLRAMFLIAIAYQQLNSAEPDCGTTFTWATRRWASRAGGSAAGASSPPPTSSSWRTWRRSRPVQLPVDGSDAGRVLAVVHRRASSGSSCLITATGDRGIGATAVRAAGHRAHRADRASPPWHRPGQGHTGNGLPDSLTPSLSLAVAVGLSLSALVTATLIAVFVYWGWRTPRSLDQRGVRRLRMPAPPLSRPCAAGHLRAGVRGHRRLRRHRATDLGLAGGQLRRTCSPPSARRCSAMLRRQGHGDPADPVVSSRRHPRPPDDHPPTARTSLSMGASKALPRASRIHPRYWDAVSLTIWMGAVSIIFYVGSPWSAGRARRLHRSRSA